MANGAKAVGRALFPYTSKRPCLQGRIFGQSRKLRCAIERIKIFSTLDRRWIYRTTLLCCACIQFPPCVRSLLPARTSYTPCVVFRKLTQYACVYVSILAPFVYGWSVRTVVSIKKVKYCVYLIADSRNFPIFAAEIFPHN